MSSPTLTNYVSGQGQVSSDNLNTFFQTCTNMAQLRAFAGNNPAITVYVRGTTTANDGGQGTFYWNASVTGTDDNGVTTIVPTGVTIGCWTRQTGGALLLATSSSSVTIGTGSKTFTVSQISATLTIGAFVIIASRANVANYMHGQITSFSGSTMVVNVTDTGGSGTLADWNIILSGTQGSAGANPAFNTIVNGTNTSAAMVVGSGASISFTGTGTIAATSSSVTNALASATTVVDVSAATAPSSGQVLTATSSTTATWQNVSVVLAVVYPVGTYYFNETDSTNPSVLFGFGTWVAVTDKFIVAHGSTYTSTGGAATVTLVQNNLPATLSGLTSTLGNVDNVATGRLAGADTANTRTGTFTIANPGGGQSFSIIPTYQAAYVWKRTV